MRPWYAINARSLLETRQRGMAPNGPVAVALAGPDFVSDAAITIRVRDDMPAERLDWRMLVNLDVWVMADSTVALGAVQLHLDRIARARPRRLFLRFAHQHRYQVEFQGEISVHSVDMHDIEVGDGRHHPAVLDIPAVHQFVWCPTNNAGTPLGAKLRKALLTKHPAFTTL